MERVRVGIIGTGRISDLHAAGYLADPRAEIVAVCDTNAALARERGRRWGVAEAGIFTDTADLLARDEVDLVEILVPHHLHHPLTLAAIAAGKHVSVQKPMAISLTEADAMIEAAHAAGVVLKLFENFLFYPPVIKATELIEAGAIGKPLSIRLKTLSGRSANAWPVPPSAWAWRQNAGQCGGGPLTFDDGHHKLALAWHFLGLPEMVHAWIGETRVTDTLVFDCPALISWRLADGRIGNLEIVHAPALEIWTRHYAIDDRIEITGEKGIIWITRGHGRIGDQPPVILYADGETRGFSGLETGWETSFVNSAQDMIDALLTGRPPVLTGEQGREILRFALAAQEAARLDRAVRV